MAWMLPSTGEGLREPHTHGTCVSPPCSHPRHDPTHGRRRQGTTFLFCGLQEQRAVFLCFGVLHAPPPSSRPGCPCLRMHGVPIRREAVDPQRALPDESLP